LAETITARYEVRQANVSDLPFFQRAAIACQHEDDVAEEVDIYYGLLHGTFEAYLLIGENTRVGVRVERNGSAAVLGTFYREGPPSDLVRESRILLEKVTDHLSAEGIRYTFCFIHRSNPLFPGLKKFYERLGFDWDLVRFGKEI